ncbi:MAG: hypothetical protein CSB46_04225, partial [Micrococcales bacterium]
MIACSALSGCGGYLVESGSQGSPTAGSDDPSTGAATPTGEPIGQLDSLGDTSEKAEFATYYDQELDWQRCGKFECATVQVPMDWTRPEGASIALELLRRPAAEPDERIGSLVYNPGGPGSSGVEMVKEQGGSLISSDVAKRYDLVGFDPRGVGSSEPIDCVSDKDLDEWMAADFQPDTPEGFQEGSELAADFAKGCEQHTGALLPYVDTWSAARDMDVIRQALGDDQLHYLGASYGTTATAWCSGRPKASRKPCVSSCRRAWTARSVTALCPARSTRRCARWIRWSRKRRRSRSRPIPSAMSPPACWSPESWPRCTTMKPGPTWPRPWGGPNRATATGSCFWTTSTLSALTAVPTGPTSWRRSRQSIAWTIPRCSRSRRCRSRP